MALRKLHVICLDVPFPADYGGAIDMFYRLKGLHELDVELTIHVFEYGRGKAKELENFGKVIYYRRKKSIWQMFSSRPFIVESRKDNELLENLRKDTDPILFEGIHTIWPLEFEDIRSRLTFIRMHNIEHEYYKGLAQNSGWIKRIFFELEVRKLKNYQANLSKAKYLLGITQKDTEHLKQLNTNSFTLPASFPDIEGKYTPVKRYALFHGNLSVPENEQAVKWIVETLKPVMDPTFPLFVAGKNPSKSLKAYCDKNAIKIFVNPYGHHMEKLIQEAQIHVMYSSVPAGLKLKLLACVYSSGHIIVNSQMIEGTGLDEFCTVCEDAKDYKMHFIGSMNSVVSKEEFEAREKFIKINFSNTDNLSEIIKIIDHEMDSESV